MPEAALTTAQEADIAKVTDTKTAQENPSDIVTHTPNKTPASEVNIKKAETQTAESDATGAANSTNVTYVHKTKGVMSDNSTATSKTKTSSNTNGNGSAPKTKKGALDPNRLPDSSGDNLDNLDSIDSIDINKD